MNLSMMLGKLDAPSFTQINLTKDHFQETEEVIILNPTAESNSTNPSTMNLSETVINNVEIETCKVHSADKLYDTISNDSKDNNFIESNRIIYSRDQLISIYKLSNSVHLGQIINNPNFPKREEMQSSEDYFAKLIEFDCSNFRCQTKRINKPENGNNIKHKKELGFNDEDERRNDQQFESNNLRLNRPFIQQQENLTKPEFSKNTFNSNGNYNNNLPSNSNFNKNLNVNNKFNERSQMFNNRNDRMEDRNDGRSFLRSRGENLNQNFASFRRFPNRNQNASNNNNYKPYHHNQRDAEPEWFTDTITQHDTIELKGFDDDEDKLNLSKNSNLQKQPQTHQQEKTQNHSNQSPVSSLNNEKQKDDFDLSELTNFDWQSVDAKAQQDTKSIDYQGDSSRFARWFNEPALVNSVAENQIEKLFSSARSSINGIPNSPQPNNHHTQQQINLQNDFFGNLMNRSNNSQHQNSNSQHYHQQQIKQTEANEFKMNNQPNKKTDQQLLNILQKARINVDSLLVQQNVNLKNNVIKGEVKSAEELEASLLNNAGENNNGNSKIAIDQQQIKLQNVQPHHHVQHQQSHSQHVNPSDLFQKLSLPKNEFVSQDQSSKNDNSAINPFVLNLLDNAQNKPQKTVNFVNTAPMNNKKPNYLQNMMFANNQDKVNPFMPTSVIRKIANEKNNLAYIKSANEANFEIVTGSLTNERSFVGRENLNVTNHTINQNNIMHQNFAIATGMRWNDNNIQFHRVDSTTPDYKNELNEGVKSMNTEALKNILLKASKKTVDPHSILNNFSNQQPLPTNNQFFPKVQNDNQKKLIEILQKASTNHGKPESGNKINNWFELELKRNNDHLSPIIKENAFTLEDIEKS